MAIDLSKFDAQVDTAELQKAMEAVPEYDEVPKGKYIVGIEKMEVKPTKAGDKLMFAVQCKIKETLADDTKKQDGRWIFFNRVICGNRTTEKWNDGAAIKGVLTWIDKFADSDLEFTNYSQLADDVLNIYQELCPTIELEVEYDPDAFDPIKITDVYDL